MRNVKLLSAALLAAATLATPALAATHHVRHVVTNDNANMASVMRSTDRDSCVRAPDVGAFATQPWTVPPCEPNTGY
ncbi:hypothetical protein J6524_21525 [Bradyrhizobium sp. WSM 1738]|uniref:hypothetical protein n=1 Tax=Bradyrhizobium hereditatis TaxID=2821405 RepID=UPI001CE399C6|nr:hypothetical protein [Bradyrhizobium hereditatis]MCA6117425.1 hypothetical protein [Bradyrhizobium hereditatis]